MGNEDFYLNLQNEDSEEFAVDFGEVIETGGGGGGTSDFNELTNRPKYDSKTMTGNTNIPKVPTKTSELTNDADFQTRSEVDGAINTAIDGLSIPTKTSDLTNDGSDGTSTYVEADELATVATSGSYNDLNNKPTIPEAQVNSDWNANSGVAQILNRPTLATVATSGKYTDLTDTPTIPDAQIQSDWTQSDNTKVDYIKNKPTIPTVNDAALTITQNGISKGTFTANDADDTTIEVSDTTYSNFTGTDGTVAGTAGLVPAPATTDAGKFLKADGTWDTAGGDSSVVELTTDDYNWPTSSPNGIALWLLDSGMYQISSPGATIRLYHYSDSASGASAIYGDGTTFLVIEHREGGNTTKNIYINNYWYNDWASSGLLNTGNYYDTGSALMTHKSVIDSLTSTSVVAPLSAKQGKVLNDHIGDLSSLTTTDKTSAVAAINEIAAGGGGGGVTVVQTPGTSTTDVMSQNATTSMVYADPATRQKVSIGATQNNGSYGTAIGYQSQVVSGNRAVALGYRAEANANGAVAIGTGSSASNVGEVNIGSFSSTAYGFNNSNYRLLRGLYDGQSAHDAVTVEQVNATIDAINTALSTNIPHIGASN